MKDRVEAIIGSLWYMLEYDIGRYSRLLEGSSCNARNAANHTARQEANYLIK